MTERTNLQEIEHDVTTAIARLPGLDINVTHQRGQNGEWEEVHIVARATPSFESVGRAFEAANPFKLWVDAARLMWTPWLLLTQPMMLPGNRREPR